MATSSTLVWTITKGFLFGLVVLLSVYNGAGAGSDWVGHCTRKTLAYRYKSICLRKLYLSFQLSKHVNCRESYMKDFIDCTSNETKRCFPTNSNSVEMKRALNETVEHFKRSKEIRFYCNSAGLPSDPPIPGCNGDAVVAIYYRCREHFLLEFRQNQSSRSLCHKYSTFLECFLPPSKQLCEHPYPIFTGDKESLYSVRANPFCTMEPPESLVARSVAQPPLNLALHWLFVVPVIMFL